MIADVYTLDTTYALQLQDDQDDAGTWHHHSQAEYTTEAKVRQLGKEIYGGECTTRVIRIERHVI